MRSPTCFFASRGDHVSLVGGQLAAMQASVFDLGQLAVGIAVFFGQPLQIFVASEGFVLLGDLAR